MLRIDDQRDVSAQLSSRLLPIKQTLSLVRVLDAVMQGMQSTERQIAPFLAISYRVVFKKLKPQSIITSSGLFQNCVSDEIAVLRLRAYKSGSVMQ